MNNEMSCIILKLINSGVSVNKNKLSILLYIQSQEGVSMRELSKNLKIDYKNVWRICKEFKDKKVLDFGDETIGKGLNIKLKKTTKRSLTKIGDI